MHSFQKEAAGCLFGYPIAHSLSPLLHQTVFENSGIKWTFTLLESKDIQEVLTFLKSPNCFGCAVTMPFKVAILQHLDGLTPEGHDCGAVNTVMIKTEADGTRKYIGTNTDVVGIREAFYQNISSPSTWEGRPGLVIGSGGAARSAVYSLRRMMNCKPVYIVNRFANEVEDVIKECQSKGFGQNLIHVETVEQAQALAAPGAVVSCVPDFHPNTEEEFQARQVIETFLGKEEKGAFLEMCYHPSVNTRLSAISENAGWQVILGTEAMIYQGLEQQKLWTGKPYEELPVEKVKSVIMEKLSQLQH